MEIKELLSLKESVISIVKEGGTYLSDRFTMLREGAFLEVEEKGTSDFVTQVDRQVEGMILSKLEKLTPGVKLVAEETHCDWGGGSVPPTCWILDPLDGTRNFIRGYARFAVSLGLRIDGEMVMGVIYDPEAQDLFHGIKGEGAWHNERSMQLSSGSDPSRWTVSLGMPFKAVRCVEEFLGVYRELFSRGTAIRHTGSAALDLAYTAAGIFDGTIGLAMAPWDVAAGMVLVEEAGGKTAFLEDSPLLLSCSLVAASQELFSFLEKNRAVSKVAHCLKQV